MKSTFYITDTHSLTHIQRKLKASRYDPARTLFVSFWFCVLVSGGAFVSNLQNPPALCLGPRITGYGCSLFNVGRRLMIRVCLFSEDRTLQPILSSALGKEFQVHMEPSEADVNGI